MDEQKDKLISSHIFILPFKILNPDNIDRIELLLKEKEKWEDCKINPDVEKYLNKGNQIAIQGRLQTGSYVNKDGVKVYTTDVVADRVEFLNTKTKNGEDMPDGLEDIKDEIPF